jgi:hypothetical protein
VFEVKWGKAFGLGLRFFIMSTIFTIVGFTFIASAISINLLNEGPGKYAIVIDFSNVFESVGTLTLLTLGFMTLVVGNTASFFKLMSEVMKENGSEYLWQ